jgi:hypothetical protein
MRKMIALSGIGVLAAVLLAQTQNNKAKEPVPVANAALNLTPLNVKTGLWQMTETITWQGLPPQMAASMNNGVAINYKSCVKQENLSSNPWVEGSGHTCHWSTLSSNGSDMEVQGDSCDLGKDYGMTANVKGSIHVTDSQDGTGSFDIVLTGNGQSMHGHASYTGQWVAATCPAGMN